VPALLFIVLAPGGLLSLPPTIPADKDAKANPKASTALWFTGRVTFWNVLVHAIVYAFLLGYAQMAVGYFFVGASSE